MADHAGTTMAEPREAALRYAEGCEVEGAFPQMREPLLVHLLLWAHLASLGG